MVHVVSDEEDFFTQVIGAGDRLVVIDFHATWCGPCKMIAPFFAELSEEFQDVVFLKLDIDEIVEIANEYHVTSIPKFVFIKNKLQVAEMLGTDQDKLKNMIVENK